MEDLDGLITFSPAQTHETQQHLERRPDAPAARHLALFFGYRMCTICEYVNLHEQGGAISREVLLAAPKSDQDSWERRYIAVRDDFHDARRRSGKAADEWFVKCAQDATEALRLVELEAKQSPGAEDLRLELLFRLWEAQHRVSALKAQGNATWSELQRLRTARYAGPAAMMWFQEELLREMAQD